MSIYIFICVAFIALLMIVMILTFIGLLISGLHMTYRARVGNQHGPDVARTR